MKLFIMIVMISGLLGGSVFKDNIDLERVNYLSGNQKDARAVIIKSIFDNKDLDINRMEIKNEDDFVKYIEGILEEVKNTVSKDTISKDDKEVLKKTFVDMADFVFYNKEIKGYKFKDLSLTSKKEVLVLLKDLDSKIEEKYPNYKSGLETFSKNNYNNIKEKSINMLNEYKEQLKIETYKSCKKEGKSILNKINKTINNWIKKVSE